MAATTDSPQPWDFQPVFDLLDAFRIVDADVPQQILDNYDPTSKPSTSLGDFDRMFEHLGWKVYPRERTISRSSQSADHNTSDSTPLSSPIDGDTPKYDLSSINKSNKTVRWVDPVSKGKGEIEENLGHNRNHPWGLPDSDDNSASPSKSKARRKRRKASQIHDARISADFESDIEEREGLPFQQPNPVPRPLGEHYMEIYPWKLYPSRPTGPRTGSDYMQPLDTLTFEEKRLKLIKKLISRFGSNMLQYSQYLNTPLSLRMKSPPVSTGIHVFVDLSNITIGWSDQIKLDRGYNKGHKPKQPPLCWDFLAMILERGRPVARRILLGSRGPTWNGLDKPLPEYVRDAEKCGYEINILERVLKPKPQTPRKSNGEGTGYATASGYSSSDGKRAAARKINVEQGVDEILQMKILESLVDHQEPSTIVLASGDGAEAEYSGGFLQNVKRALTKGWKVELVSWKAGLASEYRAKSFISNWKSQFTIIELDDYCEDLLAIFAIKRAPYLVPCSDFNTWNTLPTPIFFRDLPPKTS